MEKECHAEHSCFFCHHYKVKQVELTGSCNWFKEVKGEEPKVIPQNILEVGCKKFVSQVPF